MANSYVETGVTWDTGSASKTVSSSTVVWSDAVSVNADDWDGSVSLSADNSGTPASGDIVDWYIAWTNGDILGDSGDDYDTTEHAEPLYRMDTVAANTPGEDPARRTLPIDVSGKKAFKIGASCPQAGTRNIVLRVRYGAHRAA